QWQLAKFITRPVESLEQRRQDTVVHRGIVAAAPPGQPLDLLENDHDRQPYQLAFRRFHIRRSDGLNVVEQFFDVLVRLAQPLGEQLGDLDANHTAAQVLPPGAFDEELLKLAQERADRQRLAAAARSGEQGGKAWPQVEAL